MNRLTFSPLITPRDRVFSRTRKRSNAGHFLACVSESEACSPSTNDLRRRDLVSCHLLKSVTMVPSEARIWSNAPLAFISFCTCSPSLSICVRKNCWRSSGVSSAPFSCAICSICWRASSMAPRHFSCISGAIMGAIIWRPISCMEFMTSSRAGSNASS